MDTIIFATGNKNKMIEIRMILADLGCKILSQKEAGIQADVVEDGQTFEENALIKATTIADIARKMPEYKNAVVLADDSGLEIDALNKEPGIYSARYMGEDTSYDIKNQALIDRLEGVPDEKRTARFVCAIAAALPDGSTEVVRGTMEGRIGYEITGENGFGYDPIFYLPQFGCSSAELEPEKKNELSHRGEGLRKMRKVLEEKLEQGVISGGQERVVYVKEDGQAPAEPTPRPELPNAVPEDVQQVVKNFRPIADEASGMLRTYLKKARLSLAGDNRLMIVMPDALGADFVGREDRRKELESLIENRIGKKVEVEGRHVEEGRRFEDTFVDIEKKINMEIIVED